MILTSPQLLKGAIVGALIGLIGATGGLLYGSIIGAVIGVIKNLFSDNEQNYGIASKRSNGELFFSPLIKW